MRCGRRLEGCYCKGLNEIERPQPGTPLEALGGVTNSFLLLPVAPVSLEWYRFTFEYGRAGRGRDWVRPPYVP